jgi:UDP-N-acetylglucosamine--N-acetylmuramyl-(pentapeptide) pyrophosphoryl-undecaprenol N-acetylglucosamine transferase
MLNIDLVPGKANKLLSRFADRICLQWPESARYFGGPRGRLTVTGCPIRSQIIHDDRAAARAHFRLSQRRKTLLITGASQGAQSINVAVLALLDRLDALADSWQVVHIAGSLDSDRVSMAYAGRQITNVVVDFADRMGWLYAASDLVIGRAGASSLAEFAATGLPAVLMPYPYHGDHHQRLNAGMLTRRGAAVIVDDAIDPAANAPRLWAALEPLMKDPGRLAAMSAAASAAGTRDAADRIAEHLCRLAGV